MADPIITDPGDDIISDEESEAANKQADALFDEILDRLDDGDEDPVAVAYGLWCSLTRYLAEGGWTSEDLARDAAHHAADQMAEGRG